MVIIAIVMFFPRITALFKSEDPSDTATDLSVMLVKSEDPAQADMVKEMFAASFIDYEVQITNAEISVIKERITSGEVACAFIMNGATSFAYYVDNLSMYDTNPDVAIGVLQQIYQMNAMISGGMSEEDAAGVMNIQIDCVVESLGKDQLQNFFYTYIMIFALYMVILLYGQMVAMSVATEKSSRAMELLITSAKTINMMFGKVLAACMAGLVQLIAILARHSYFTK